MKILKFPAVGAVSASLVVCSCGTHERGDSGQSLPAGDRIVLISNGYANDRVAYAVLRSWPISATAEEKSRTDPFVLGAAGRPMIKGPKGVIDPWAHPPQAYVFEDGKLTTFPIRMDEDALGELTPGKMKSFEDVIAYFRRFEAKVP